MQKYSWVDDPWWPDVSSRFVEASLSRSMSDHDMLRTQPEKDDVYKNSHPSEVTALEPKVAQTNERTLEYRCSAPSLYNSLPYEDSIRFLKIAPGAESEAIVSELELGRHSGVDGGHMHVNGHK